MSVRSSVFCFLTLHAVPVAAGFAGGFWVGFALMAAVHGFLVFTTLSTGATVFCPAWRRFSTTEREVCLTIDDGPCADTAEFLEILAAQDNARAMFFLIGERAAARPEDTRAIAAAGHGIGNHTLTHPATRFWAYAPGAQRREITGCQEALRRVTGRAPRWFRAPAGFRNPFTWPVLRESGLRYAGWQARGCDTATADIPLIVERLTRGLVPGAILLLHQGHPHSPALLRALLAWLKAHGWKVTLPAEFDPATPPS